ncbi:Short-chain dehydrogenase TIC 32 B, chloroplastic [Linum perenne]
MIDCSVSLICFASHNIDGFSCRAGATSGIGAETARVLAKRGARVVIPARSMKAAEDTKARILSECPDATIIVMALDLSSLRSVRSFVAEFESLDLPLNLLINNAGKFAHQHAISEDGIEMSFATNYLGHFLLTNLLLKKMIETARETGVQGRIVNVSSAIHGWFAGDMLQYLEEISGPKWDATRAYALSKLANVLHTKHLALTLKVSPLSLSHPFIHLIIFSPLIICISTPLLFLRLCCQHLCSALLVNTRRFIENPLLTTRVIGCNGSCS